ncbi:phBC6A51 family helix-turn-helix protein [Paenibacillus sp. CC-CFT747]|nr:phBC6A51 family helix-turn-helix protein [Paenibacillus sp. CC-CFT747]
MKHNEKLLSPEQMRAAEMMLSKRQTGATLQEIADEFQISERQLRRWRDENPAFREFMKRRALEMAGDSLNEVMAVLTEKALQGNNKSIEIYLKSLGIWAEKIDITARQVQPDDNSNEALERSIKELSKELCAMGLDLDENKEE